MCRKTTVLESLLNKSLILNKTATKIFTILTKCFFPYMSPTRYVKDTIKADF